MIESLQCSLPCRFNVERGLTPKRKSGLRSRSRNQKTEPVSISKPKKKRKRKTVTRVNKEMKKLKKWRGWTQGLRSQWNSEYSINTSSSLYSAQLMVLKLLLFLLQYSETKFRNVSIILFHRFRLRNFWRCCTTSSFYTSSSLRWSARLWGILRSFIRLY